MKLAIYNLKKHFLHEAKELLKKEKSEHGVAYLELFIKHNEIDLFGQETPPAKESNEAIEKLLSELDFGIYEAKILAMLLTNESLTIKDCGNIKADRALKYRIFASFVDKGIIVKLPGQVNRYKIINKDSLFDDIIEAKLEDINKYTETEKLIRELL